MAQIAPRAGHGQAAGEHYHPFEEIYYFLSGGLRGMLDGDEVEVAAGDLLWAGVDATHGFVNERDARPPGLRPSRQCHPIPRYSSSLTTGAL